MERAARSPLNTRKVFLNEAKRVVGTLPQEWRTPLEDQIQKATSDEDIQRLLATIRAYRKTLDRPPAPPPLPQQVRSQLDALFSEPDMQIPPKSLPERLSEAFLNALEAFVRWLNRLLGGLGGAPAMGGMQMVFQILVIVLLVLTIGLVITYLIGRVRFARRSPSPALSKSSDFQDARTMSAQEWYALAQRLAAEQNWQLALRASYLGILRLLHESHLLDYDPALTNWEHLQQLRKSPSLRWAASPAPLPDAPAREEAYQLLFPLTLQFDLVWYGGSPPDEGVYRQFRDAFETLLRRLQSRAVPA
ncbi:MAG: DUF4129 domain-containing protein [Fimbriimonadales bacterium]|nr:DUF4129 domain-containing protein [Fimbriimonadales bacterium]